MSKVRCLPSHIHSLLTSPKLSHTRKIFALISYCVIIFFAISVQHSLPLFPAFPHVFCDLDLCDITLENVQVNNLFHYALETYNSLTAEYLTTLALPQTWTAFVTGSTDRCFRRSCICNYTSNTTAKTSTNLYVLYNLSGKSESYLLWRLLFTKHGNH